MWLPAASPFCPGLAYDGSVRDHSMSMEFFTYPWMDLFFGKNTEKYKYAHFVSAMTFIPYMACVDEFPHRVFEENAVDAAKRKNLERIRRNLYAMAGL